MTLGGLALSLLLQAGQATPVLAFPEPGLDDSSAYQGYQTRFYRDSKKNAIQIYLEPRGGRVVHLWADAANESAGFTVRDAAGRPVRTTWGAEPADVADSGASRSIEYRLIAGAPHIELGWFLLGSMRIERDFQYAGRHLLPFRTPPFRVAEESLLVADVAGLPAEERRRHLALLNARTMEDLSGRLQPTVAATRAGDSWRVRVERPSLDGRNRLALEFRTAAGDALFSPTPRTVAIRSRTGGPVALAVRVITDAEPLTPLDRAEIFNRDFHDFLSAAAAATDSAGRVRSRRLERQVRGVELLSTKEKLMAGLPNFATYFGRDMMMTALMMRPVWSPAMAEHVIASVLRKLGPGGAVSHEEALGGQAIRENALVYDSLVTGYLRAARASRRSAADSLLERAGEVLRNLQATRENYHMIDDEYQLPVLEARYLADSAVPAARKREFLLDTADGGGTRLARMLREMALVTSATRPYVEDPRALNLVSFPKRDSIHWRSASWRDSDAGYAGGRFAMDVNAVWVPQALDAIATILSVLPRIGVGTAALDSLAPEIGRYAAGRLHPRHPFAPSRHRDLERSTAALRGHARAGRDPGAAARKARAAARGRATILGEGPGRQRRAARLACLSRHRTRRQRESDPGRQHRPGDGALPREPDRGSAGAKGEARSGAAGRRAVRADISCRALRGPAGAAGGERRLRLAGNLGALQEGSLPRPARRVGTRGQPALPRPGEPDRRRVRPGRPPYRSRAPALPPRPRRGPTATLAAVHESGLEHNELWSYRIEAGHLLPSRYGTSSDIQLWNGTNLAVQFVLSRLPRP